MKNKYKLEFESLIHFLKPVTWYGCLLYEINTIYVNIYTLYKFHV